jgi:hypothetical protein
MQAQPIVRRLVGRNLNCPCDDEIAGPKSQFSAECGEWALESPKALGYYLDHLLFYLLLILETLMCKDDFTSL